MATIYCVCVYVRDCACVEHGTGAKHNRGDEKNTTGLAHSRASRYRCVTNRKTWTATPGPRRPETPSDGEQLRRGCTCGCVSVCPSSVSAAATRAAGENSTRKCVRYV